MDTTSQAFTHWSSGEALEAGRLIYERIPTEQRPLWAAAILDECRRLIHSVPEINKIYELALDRSRWREAHAAFWPVRTLTLKAEENKATDPLYKAILYVTENTAKVIYNASGRPAPFDHDAGWWLVSNLRHVVDLLNDADFGAKAWSLVITTTQTD